MAFARRVLPAYNNTFVSTIFMDSYDSAGDDAERDDEKERRS